MKSFKPTSASRRSMTVVTYRGVLSGDKPHKPLLSYKKRQGGRNNAGRITTRHQGGGHKRMLRDVDFKYNKHDIPARIETIEYDPYRTAFIARTVFADGERRYVTVPKDMKVGDTFIVSEKAPIKTGNRLPLGKIPSGTFIYNVELRPGAGARIARSAGNYAEIVAHDAGYAQIKMPSSEVRKVIESAWASVGAVGNEEQRLQNYGKAGKSRWKGIRPTVRGTAMNPVDHPHGGGEGKQGRGLRRAKSMWGKPTGKGQKTRTPKKYSNKFIVSRRKVGKKR
ncbi:50S ribosomal protein L2 [Patescibacteria group bacterium]|nr:50S ribosomal protein L2 [Patescibacteria group bacterium]MBU1500572.1 50S ribosomal protein L2 [Patescibacteria group bacterium]MBU2080459.1 50S ribosomal protein L2 [Patescibacteria group bacterium]MBU2123736.1 50S ribosomal protein L2 [Patescibacteria group bacterium]MBU2194592.1 50S ribosomal protein L2 [Patescibacteria group bacterium]